MSCVLNPKSKIWAFWWVTTWAGLLVLKISKGWTRKFISIQLDSSWCWELFQTQLKMTCNSDTNFVVQSSLIWWIILGIHNFAIFDNYISTKLLNTFVQFWLKTCYHGVYRASILTSYMHIFDLKKIYFCIWKLKFIVLKRKKYPF